MAESEPAAAFESVTDLLGEDHRRLDALLAAAKQALHAGDAERGRAQFSAFRAGLERHIEAEEEVLFPAFERLTGAAGAGPTHVMRTEHRELRKLMAEIDAALEGGAGAGRAAPLAALTALVYAHNGKEERILYPATDHAARAADELDALVRRLNVL
jgi:iron-sulfur cluster repair protein YtfE (RIC family)